MALSFDTHKCTSVGASVGSGVGVSVGEGVGLLLGKGVGFGVAMEAVGFGVGDEPPQLGWPEDQQRKRETCRTRPVRVFLAGCSADCCAVATAARTHRHTAVVDTRGIRLSCGCRGACELACLFAPDWTAFGKQVAIGQLLPN